jgi:hypothetical protein
MRRLAAEAGGRERCDQMARKVIGPTGSRRRRWVFLCTAAVTIALAVLIVPSALAVHDEAFQLDGDVSASTTTNYGPPGTTQLYDWDSMFDASGTAKSPLPTGFGVAAFKTDYTLKNGGFGNLDNSTYTQGSKDIDNISSWVCTPANNVTDKGDIVNAYATSYTTAGGSQFLYFALERSSNNGDANVGFWFLQDGTAGCDAANGTTNFTGAHQDGDIFIVSAFTKGGNVSTITAYRWNGGANGSLGSTPVGTGGDCRDAGNPLGDSICATSNTGTIPTPWLTDNNGKNTGFGHSLNHGEFFEGGIDLTQTHLGDKCFNTFIPDTRSSQSLTATLYDFAVGRLGECHSTTVTTPTPAAGTTPTLPANAQLSSSDSAHVTVDGVPKFSGTVTFYICGPSVASGANCQTGGDQVSQSTLTDATSPQDVTSTSVTLTEVGKYCWRAVYSGDSTRGVPGSTDPKNATDQSECFNVGPRTPHLATCSGSFDTSTGVCTPASDVDFGNSVSDNAHLTGTADRPGSGGIGSDGSINGTGQVHAGGSITFKLFKADCTTLAAGFPAAGLTSTVNGDGYYGPVSYTPTEPGTYYWDASYPADSPNTNAATDDTSCPNNSEKVIVRQIPTTIATAQSAYPNDSATITSSVAGNLLPSGGTVVFRLYGPTGGATPKTALQNCQAHGDTVNSGGLLYKETKTNIGGANSVTTGTANTSVSVNVSETYYWRVTYAPGDTAHTGRQSDCAENTVLTFNNDAGPGSLFP